LSRFYPLDDVATVARCLSGDQMQLAGNAKASINNVTMRTVPFVRYNTLQIAGGKNMLRDNQNMAAQKRENARVFREVFGASLFRYGFIYKSNMFVRVHPGCGAIFVYFKTVRKVSYDIKVSVISFAADQTRLRNPIDNNAVSIWSFRVPEKEEILNYSSAHAFISSANRIFDDTVLPNLVKLHDCTDFLQYYSCFLDGFFRNRLKFKETKIPIALQCNDFDYVETVLKAWEKNLVEYRTRVEASHDIYYDQCINSIAIDMERIKAVRMIITKDNKQMMRQYLEERMTYWDSLFRSSYAVFYPF